MADAQPVLALLSPHQPSLLMLAMLAVAPITWRSTGPPERASALTLGGVAVLDLATWWLTGGSALLHAMADSLALGWMVPVALRANRFYPAMIAAALLVAATAQWLFVLGLVELALPVELLAGGAHLVALFTYLCGWQSHRYLIAKSGQRPAWRHQRPFR
jgi:hypothetical protein